MKLKVWIRNKNTGKLLNPYVVKGLEQHLGIIILTGYRQKIIFDEEDYEIAYVE